VGVSSIVKSQVFRLSSDPATQNPAVSLALPEQALPRGLRLWQLHIEGYTREP